jgi:hypothetical protein
MMNMNANAAAVCNAFCPTINICPPPIQCTSTPPAVQNVKCAKNHQGIWTCTGKVVCNCRC